MQFVTQILEHESEMYSVLLYKKIYQFGFELNETNYFRENYLKGSVFTCGERIKEKNGLLLEIFEMINSLVSTRYTNNGAVDSVKRDSCVMKY